MSVVLVDLLDDSSEEAGELMGIKASTVRVLASKGRALSGRTQERSMSGTKQLLRRAKSEFPPPERIMESETGITGGG